MLGFESGSGEYALPEIGEAERKVLERFIELYEKRGNLLDKLIEQAKKKMEFSEESVRFWAPLLVEGKLGPLEPLLADPEIEEIMVNGIGKNIFVYHRKRGMLETGLKITSRRYFLGLANRILANLGRRVDEAHPRANGILENGDRIAVLIPPYARDYIMDIRRFSAEPLTIIDLVKNNMLDYRLAAFLWLVMEAGNINVGIAGNTGSGKTTLLNALLRFVPVNSRIVLVEEVPEIRPLQKQVVRLISVEALGISMHQAIIDSLRLRPDRTVIGEVRSGEEVKALHESCLAGQALGTYFTYHADSAFEARRRLLAQGFEEQDLGAIDMLVIARRSEIKGRTVRRVVEVEFRGGEWEKSRIPELEEVFGDWKRELEEREAWLSELKPMRDEKIFREIQRYMGYV